MGYRFMLAVVLVSLLSGCAAFDTDNTPYADWNPNEVVFPVGIMPGPYSGNYTGTMTLDSSTCQSLSDEVGAAVPLDVDALQSEKLVKITFEDESAMVGELSAENKAIFVVQNEGAKHVYYLTFSEDSKINGSCEVIEPDENGQYAKACGSYTVVFTKSAEKSAE